MTDTLRPDELRRHTPGVGVLAASPPPERRRVRIGTLLVDAVSLDEALDAVGRLVALGSGGAVFTPNVDHIVTAEHDPRLRDAYRGASLSLPDGMPVVWASRLLGTPLPAKVSGSDLIAPLARLAASKKWRVYLLGGAPGVVPVAAARLRERCGLHVVGWDDAFLSTDEQTWDDAVCERIRHARPDLVLVALGSPKQELWIRRTRGKLGPAVAVGIGASLDFVAGRVRRAPGWMSRTGFEWLFRLVQEPRRLWRRYLVKDPAFLMIVLRSLRAPRLAGPVDDAL